MQTLINHDCPLVNKHLVTANHWSA